MRYEVRCACGNVRAVTAADAGASVRCGCGHAVEVPPLHQLRTAAGLALSPLTRLRGASLAGRLPGTTVCCCCRKEPGPNVRVAIECERVPSPDAPSQADQAGCLLGWLLGMFSVQPVLAGIRAVVNREGDVTSVTVPLPVCAGCRPTLDEAGLSFALRRIPEYADVLDSYPQARFALAR